MAYHVTLDVFEGPMDLLLYLTQQARVDIKDIFISEITQQYLDYVARMNQDDMDRTSAFVTMAAHLMEIKSRRMLPRSAEEEEALEEDEAELIARLENYKRYKQACEMLRQMHDEAAKVFSRKPEELVVEEQFDLRSVSVDALAKALAVMLSRVPDEMEQSKAEREIERETFTVQEKILLIRKRLLHETEVGFFSLFDDRVTRDEVVTTILALLELVKRQTIHLIQEDYHDELRIRRMTKEERHHASA